MLVIDPRVDRTRMHNLGDVLVGQPVGKVERILGVVWRLDQQHPMT